ncbi:hypothetical protein [Sphingosinicella sp. BN140058]|uniref:hypothetical protein n=1 Tax=Sphingosinicella sp. BN140058 TaxID=1892855 RepID=UPI001012523E|nr:hypothetical protein [Sphingosinicella sp. BN140058]QAY80322.1 hypothetical protein ETR14_27145 [Sphingosinicella sp. BN140058]
MLKNLILLSLVLTAEAIVAAPANAQGLGRTIDTLLEGKRAVDSYASPWSCPWMKGIELAACRLSQLRSGQRRLTAVQNRYRDDRASTQAQIAPPAALAAKVRATRASISRAEPSEPRAATVRLDHALRVCASGNFDACADLQKTPDRARGLLSRFTSR